MKVIRQLLSCPKLIACARTHTHTHTYTRTRARACKHVYTHTTCTHTNTHTYTNTHARTHMQACIYTHHLHTHTHNTQVGTWQQASQAFPPLWPPSCARDSTPHKLPVFQLVDKGDQSTRRFTQIQIHEGQSNLPRIIHTCLVGCATQSIMISVRSFMICCYDRTMIKIHHFTNGVQQHPTNTSQQHSTNLNTECLTNALANVYSATFHQHISATSRQPEHRMPDQRTC